MFAVLSTSDWPVSASARHIRRRGYDKGIEDAICDVKGIQDAISDVKCIEDAISDVKGIQNAISDVKFIQNAISDVKGIQDAIIEVKGIQDAVCDVIRGVKFGVTLYSDVMKSSVFLRNQGRM